MSLHFQIPGDKTYTIRQVVFDLNGTLAVGGEIAPSVQQLLTRLASHVQLYVITADTHQTAPQIQRLLGDAASVKVISGTHTAHEKERFVESLGAHETIALGNGANDMKMLEKAALSVAIIGGEGVYAPLLAVADLAVTRIEDALVLLLEPNRLVATLRR
ncbi:ATPase P [Anoxynatronum buryatiense]|uniref:ATPase, P-type (Transporting), HAD superfamily, subfamily IC n=1 Tax=Anoxynatronum buryatiense TaxID=489973 RepID=A0AA46AJ44_9CLOT|nr:ATPase P [Anoxynatronum buryatiense]SMP57218.1 ATPase, P-type (transporting), HAD superfamily, subfamily IC [Anoxynatronum buryatiense]